MLPGPCYRGLITMRTLFTWELRREHGVYCTPGYAYTYSVPDEHPLNPVGHQPCEGLFVV